MAIELWAARLTRPLTEREAAMLTRLLPPERRERLMRVSAPERRQEALCAYALLAHALWEQYRWRELPAVERSSLGKPHFPDFPTVHFNLSHTAGAVLVGLSGEALGVDIERIRPVSGRAMQRIAGVNSERAFFQSWVRREARSKRSGGGIGTLMEGETPLLQGERFWFVNTFPGYTAGVASRGDVRLGTLRTYTLDEML